MAKNKQSGPNNQRANVKNPNSPQHSKAHGNRGKQMNPNQKSGGKKR